MRSWSACCQCAARARGLEPPPTHSAYMAQAHAPAHRRSACKKAYEHFLHRPAPQVLSWFTEGGAERAGLRVCRVKNKFAFARGELVGGYRDLMFCAIYNGPRPVGWGGVGWGGAALGSWVGWGGMK